MELLIGNIQHWKLGGFKKLFQMFCVRAVDTEM